MKAHRESKGLSALQGASKNGLFSDGISVVTVISIVIILIIFSIITVIFMVIIITSSFKSQSHVDERRFFFLIVEAGSLAIESKQNQSNVVFVQRGK